MENQNGSKWWIISLVAIIVIGAAVYFGLRSWGGQKLPENLPEKPTETNQQNLPAKQQPEAVRDYAVSDKIVMASYYPWYGYKEGDSNWADFSVAKTDERPLIGSYKSDDPKLIDYHLSLAHASGINVFLVSWGGPNSVQDNVLKEMLRRIHNSTEYPNFKVGIYYEGMTSLPKDTPDQTFADSFSYAIKQYGTDSAFFRVGGKPVIFVYTPAILSASRWQNIFASVTREAGQAMFIAGPNAWDKGIMDYLAAFDSIAPYADKYTTLQEISANYATMVQTVRPQGKPVIATIMGGAGRVQKEVDGTMFDIDRSNGKYIKGRAAIAKQASADWIYITSWNEWYEGNIVEPSRAYGFETVKYIRDMVADFKGTAASNLVGASLAKNGNSLTNSGNQNIYAVMCVNGETSSNITYVLKPAQSENLNQTCQNIVGYLPDGSRVISH